MYAIDKLISYILTLSPAQVDKIVNHLPDLVELLEGGESSSNID